MPDGPSRKPRYACVDGYAVVPCYCAAREASPGLAFAGMTLQPVQEYDTPASLVGRALGRIKSLVLQVFWSWLEQKRLGTSVILVPVEIQYGFTGYGIDSASSKEPVKLEETRSDLPGSRIEVQPVYSYGPKHKVCHVWPRSPMPGSARYTLCAGRTRIVFVGINTLHSSHRDALLTLPTHLLRLWRLSCTASSKA